MNKLSMLFLLGFAGGCGLNDAQLDYSEHGNCVDYDNQAVPACAGDVNVYPELTQDVNVSCPDPIVQIEAVSSDTVIPAPEVFFDPVINVPAPIVNVNVDADNQNTMHYTRSVYTIYILARNLGGCIDGRLLPYGSPQTGAIPDCKISGGVNLWNQNLNYPQPCFRVGDVQYERNGYFYHKINYDTCCADGFSAAPELSVTDLDAAFNVYQTAVICIQD